MSSVMSFVNKNLPVLEEWSRFLSINSDQELDNALILIESLIDRKNAGETHLFSIIETLGNSIEKYESKYPVENLSGVEMLKFLMEQNNHRQVDLYDIAAKSDISNILSGKRLMNINHIKKLCKKYNVSSDLFLKQDTARNYKFWNKTLNT